MKTIDKLTALRAKLNQPAQSQDALWKSDQLALLREHLPKLAESAADTPLVGLVSAAQARFAIAGRPQ